MQQQRNDTFSAQAVYRRKDFQFRIWRLDALEKQGFGVSDRLPYSIRVLLENLLRKEDGRFVKPEHIESLARWHPVNPSPGEIPYLPARVLLQDFTGVPVVVDLAAMREAFRQWGGDPSRINPEIPVDLVIDHSVQVDRFGDRNALAANIALEYERNAERYALLKWAQKSLRNFRTVPPGTGICHQVNLEYLATVVQLKNTGDIPEAFPDTCVGTDSHTTMVNGLGVLGWGVGGIEAEAVMLGQPYYLLIPEVIGVKMSGSLREGATATDLVLTVTQLLRKAGVVDKFIEFTGPGLANLTIPDRTVIANMAPEYGATIGFFPVDQSTLDYLSYTGRNPEQIRLVEEYTKEQGLFRLNQSPEPEYTKMLELDLSTVEPSVAGPKRPQDRVPLKKVKQQFTEGLSAPVASRGFGLNNDQLQRSASGIIGENTFTIQHGAVVIAAITSCTNTSNPMVMIAAGLLAKKARENGLNIRPWVKTSLAPGSKVVTTYLEKSGLLTELEELRFHVVGYGCTTCIGNSGPLPVPVATAVKEGDLVVAAVLSGNRNFEGRIHPQVRANYLASPPLVVAYALAGRIDIDFESEPLGYGNSGRPVFLKDIWPGQPEIWEVVQKVITPEMFRSQYASISEGDAAWNQLPVAEGTLFNWDERSTYIKNPPFFKETGKQPAPVFEIKGARVLALLGDSVTTDHISPAGDIAVNSPAGNYLNSLGIPADEYNSYGARRGNHEVMMRGTFANIRLKNLLVPGTEGGMTVYQPAGEITTIYDAALRYRVNRVPLIIMAGKEYGTGSSRDWAAKGTALLGIRAVIAESYERIHRGNLLGMGVLPLQFQNGQNAGALGLDGTEEYCIAGLAEEIHPRQTLTVNVRKGDRTVKFNVILRLDSWMEIDYYRHGGILPFVLRQLHGQ